MKQLTKFGLITNLLLSSTVYAASPVPGFYVGFLGEISSGPASRQIVFTENAELFTGRVNNVRVGGGGAAMLGFRYQSFRIEAEGLYNWNGSNTLNIGQCTLVSPTLETTTGDCPQDHFRQKQLGFNGSIAGIYGLVNAYYDFINYNDDMDVFPYVGAGIGKVRITERSNFVNSNTQTSHGDKLDYSASAAQGILGVGMFMDDFTWGGIDYRYLTTGTIKNFGSNNRFAISSLNFTISLSFDQGSSS